MPLRALTRRSSSGGMPVWGGAAKTRSAGGDEVSSTRLDLEPEVGERRTYELHRVSRR